jgi:hypothetical protein
MRQQQLTTVVFDQLTPTPFIDFDGTLHKGRGLFDEQGNVSLDSAQPMFEYAPLLPIAFSHE